MKRIAIVLNKNLERGQVGNAAAILMGQVALLVPDIYGERPINDLNGNPHAAIRFSTVLLEANGPIQLTNLAQKVRNEMPEVICLLFSRKGQNLHNAYARYHDLISGQSTEVLEPVGSVVVGDEPTIREVTKKFSLLR